MIKPINVFVPGKTKILYGGVSFGKEEKKAIEKVLSKNWWGIDGETEKFQTEIAKVQGVKYAVFVNSGSSALDLGIRALNLPKNSEIIIPACTFPTPIASIIRQGLIPVVVDIEEGTNFIDPNSFRKAINKKTKAVLLVYVAGNVGNLDLVLKIAKRHNLIVIEDNCDGFGGTWNGQMLGTFGTFSAISTHAAHIISTGEGGVLFTNNLDLAKKVSSLRDWGRTKHKEGFTYDNLGSNYRPLELQAVMGRVQLKRLQQFKNIRRSHFDIIYKGLKPYDYALALPKVYKEANPCWFSFPFVLKKPQRKRLTVCLNQANIEWRPILAGNIANQSAFKNSVVVSGQTPNANQVLAQGLWVSVNPIWPNKAMEYIIKTIQDFFKNRTPVILRSETTKDL